MINTTAIVVGLTAAGLALLLALKWVSLIE
jgi:hypothetical protein